jgi:broad specificity phosphatase PhoE
MTAPGRPLSAAAADRPGRWWTLLIVVRHAVAVDRSDWTGADIARPLTPLGERQAEGLVERLAEHAVERILSSPAERCVETVMPLSRRRRVPVEECPALGLDVTVRALHELVWNEDLHDAVLCTHGEIIGDVLTLILADARGVDDGFGESPQWPKASTWLLQRSGHRRVIGRYLPPPAEQAPPTREDPRWHPTDGAPAPSKTPS